MRRLWARWALLVVFVVALGFVFVRLGEWQLDRLDQRRERNAVTVGNENAAPQSAAEAFSRPVTDADEWRTVRATGTFDAAHQFVVRYRHAGDDNGWQVVTPLRVTGGPTVLVDRGFVPLGPGQPIPTAAPAPPAGPVSIEGRLRANELGDDGAIVPQNGQVRLINSDALQAVLPYPIADGYLSAVSVDPPQTGGFRPIQPPELSEGPHFWYAVQWFMFTGIGVLGIVVFIRADLRERRIARAAGAGPSPGAGPVSGSAGGPAAAATRVRGDGGQQRPGPGDGGDPGRGGRPGGAGGSEDQRTRPAGRVAG